MRMGRLDETPHVSVGALSTTGRAPRCKARLSRGGPCDSGDRLSHHPRRQRPRPPRRGGAVAAGVKSIFEGITPDLAALQSRRYDAPFHVQGGRPMKVYDAAAIRNVAMVGHTGSGKTQLASAILSDTGMVNRFGKVDEGTAVTDYDEEEIARKHTLAASLAFAEWSKQKINLIDTPGMGNFLG